MPAEWEWDGDAPYFDCADITVAAVGTGADSTTNS